jgi:bacillaene synthase trans-acting acyltransferase
VQDQVVFMFSGQSSQYVQMGRALFDNDRCFRTWMECLDSVARDEIGDSIVDALYFRCRGTPDGFDRTALSHPAIFMVQFALARTLIEAGARPGLLLGYSIGAFAAAALAGVMTAEDALQAVMQQAAALEEHCTPGGMIAVLACPQLYADSGLQEVCTVAAVNFHSHFVVAASRDRLSAIEENLRRRGVAHQRLAVSFAFHSPLIDAARTSCYAFLDSIPVGAPSIPLICCGTVRFVTPPPRYYW